MKKYLLIIVVIFSLVLLWCTKKVDFNKVDFATITDLSLLEKTILDVSQEIKNGNLSMENAQNIVTQLQQKYLDLTGIVNQSIEDDFLTIQKLFAKNSVIIYWLPFWAKRLWMTEPMGMKLNAALSKQSYKNDTGYDSTVLVYTGDYAVALQQAEIIAQKANLYVSKGFQQAQALAQVGNIDYISGLDISGLRTWIIYVNHELLDTNLDNFISVSVDQSGTLIIQTTNYKI